MLPIEKSVAVALKSASEKSGDQIQHIRRPTHATLCCDSLWCAGEDGVSDGGESCPFDTAIATAADMATPCDYHACQGSSGGLTEDCCRCVGACGFVVIDYCRITPIARESIGQLQLGWQQYDHTMLA